MKTIIIILLLISTVFANLSIMEKDKIIALQDDEIRLLKKIISNN